MHIVYAAAVCSDSVYNRLFSKAKVKPAFQSQKYHRLLIEGLAAGAQVDVVANPPVNRSVMEKRIVRLPKEKVGDALYHHIAAVRNPPLKLACMAAGTFFKSLFLARRDSAVIVDVLNRTTALFALLAARLRGVPCVGIITDLPDMLSGGGLYLKIAHFVIRHCSAYVLLTEAMNDYIGNKDKPYVVLEGHADIAMAEKCPSPDRKETPRVVLYAGGVSKQYGLGHLVEGFRMANLPNARLHIYGPGDYVKELQEIAAQDNRVVYGGMLMNAEVVEKEMDAALLVNPRPTHEEFVKYSFPSKNMEYMASGTPLLTTKLPGMPKEYEPHVYLIEEETDAGVARALTRVLAHSDEELFRKGQSARDFVLKERNNVVQAKKILEMLENRK